MKSTVIAVLFAALLCPVLAGQSSGGTICVYALPEHSPGGIQPGSVSFNPATLKFKIDKRDAIPWPHKEHLKIEGLALTERHLIALYSDGKLIQSTWFRFDDGLTNLCLVFDGYGGIMLGDVKHSICKCK